MKLVQRVVQQALGSSDLGSSYLGREMLDRNLNFSECRDETRSYPWGGTYTIRLCIGANGQKTATVVKY